MAPSLTSRWTNYLRPIFAGMTFAAVTFLATFAAGVAQTSSPGISPSRITVDEPIRQGDEVRLPSLQVSNRGDERAGFTMDLLRRSEQDELAPDASWFRLSPQTFELDSGESLDVAVVMTVPEEATPGDYLAFVRATAGSPESDQSAVSIGAAVATRLQFTVENRNFHFYDPVTDFFSDRAPFSYIGVGLLLALLVAYLIRQRFKFRISFGVERRE